MSAPITEICALSASITHDVNDFQSADPQAQRNDDQDLIGSIIRRIMELKLDRFPVLTILYDCGGSGSLPAQWHRTSFGRARPCTCTDEATRHHVMILVAGSAEAREAFQFRRFRRKWLVRELSEQFEEEQGAIET